MQLCNSSGVLKEKRTETETRNDKLSNKSSTELKKGSCLTGQTENSESMGRTVKSRLFTNL